LITEGMLACYRPFLLCSRLPDRRRNPGEWPPGQWWSMVGQWLAEPIACDGPQGRHWPLR
jgi:hypothetical protein